MNPRYFKSTVSELLWKITDSGSFVRNTDGGWTDSVMSLEGMAQLTTEITAEEGEP